MDATLEQAREHFLNGVAHFEARRLDEAAAAFEASLALAPDRASVQHNLGLTRLHQGRWEDALVHLRAAAQAEPDQPGTWVALCRCLAQLGQLQQALNAVDRALTLDDTEAEGWSLRGGLLRELRRLPESAQAFERALALGAQPELHRYFLAAVSGGEASAPPRAYVEDLFDDYADSFQQHLVDVLRYRAPEQLVQALREHGAPLGGRVLDLGCGTGLCGQMLRPHCQWLEGVDLSAAMVERSRAAGVYDALHHADLAEHLRQRPRGDDLVIAADVFIYVGRLEAVFEGVAACLNPGGWLAFTVERAPEPHAVQLLPSLRHAHSETYLRQLARQHGFHVRALFEAPIREDQGRPVPGWYVLMQVLTQGEPL